MAEKKKGGLINRLIMGSEKSEGYARASLPSNRWELFWDILKGRFGKLFVINLLTILFFIPLFLLLFFRDASLSYYGGLYPFNQGFGVGYPAVPNLTGYSENIIFQVNLSSYLLLPIAMMIAAVGISGCAYVIRNMVWTEGIFVANDFWRGIRQNIKTVMISSIVYAMVFYFVTISLSFSDFMIATGQTVEWLLVVGKVLMYSFVVFVTIMYFYQITMGVTYDLKFTKLVKNSFLMSMGLLPQNLFFIFLALLPFILILLGSIFAVVGYCLTFVFGFSYCMLVWTDFNQGMFDKFINDKVPGAQKGRGIYEKVSANDAEAIKKYREQMIMVGRSSLSSRPIKPITDDELKIEELPTSFNRSDLVKLAQSKQAIYEDNERYIEEHKDEEKYQVTDEQKNLEEERKRRIEQAKRELEGGKRKKDKKDKNE